MNIICFLGDGTFSFEEFVQVMANMGGISEQSEEDEEKELREAFKVSREFLVICLRSLNNFVAVLGTYTLHKEWE